MDKKILKEVNNYYTDKINTYGATPKGVDWNSVESQDLRFEVLTRVISSDQKFSVLDFGTGFGAMYEHMSLKYTDFDFVGYDISEAMIQEAKNKHKEKNTTWLTELKAEQQYDYVIASGIFNVKLDNSIPAWEKYVFETVEKLDSLSKKGFSFNMLTKYSDKEFMKDYLYYADPTSLFDLCKTKYSKQVALLHDYFLYEFTIIVRK